MWKIRLFLDATIVGEQGVKAIADTKKTDEKKNDIIIFKKCRTPGVSEKNYVDEKKAIYIYRNNLTIHNVEFPLCHKFFLVKRSAALANLSLEWEIFYLNSLGSFQSNVSITFINRFMELAFCMSANIFSSLLFLRQLYNCVLFSFSYVSHVLRLSSLVHRLIFVRAIVI